MSVVDWVYLGFKAKICHQEVRSYLGKGLRFSPKMGKH